MSTFGTECDRAIWLEWRRTFEQPRLQGNKLRLFETGHREEARLIDDLRKAGVDVVDRDPDTDKQWKVTCVGGHLSGRLDGRALGVPEAPATWHVVELKTHNEKSFKALVKDGVAKSKPGHLAQMQFYMHRTGLQRALYLASTKNDEGLYAERITYDPAIALTLVARAERIVRASRPPAKLHEDPTAKMAFACGWCPARQVCHEGKFPRQHCRTCLHSTPVVDDSDAARWRCELHDVDLAPEDQARGCSAHLFIPDLVPYEQIDVDERGLTVTYRKPDGSLWVDGGHAGEAPAHG
ncbi:oxidoreductase [Chelatococcus reniformis]|nr:oxidoreductase [Chelatococcus reniformis]